MKGHNYINKTSHFANIINYVFWRKYSHVVVTSHPLICMVKMWRPIVRSRSKELYSFTYKYDRCLKLYFLEFACVCTSLIFGHFSLPGSKCLRGIPKKKSTCVVYVIREKQIMRSLVQRVATHVTKEKTNYASKICLINVLAAYLYFYKTEWQRAGYKMSRGNSHTTLELTCDRDKHNSFGWKL